VILSVLRFLDNGLGKIITLSSLESIKYCKTIYVPRLAPKICLEDILKEMKENSLNKINEK
jgi:nucleoside permease NupC